MNAGSSPISAPPRLLAANIPTSSCGIPRLSASAAREKINSLESHSNNTMGLKRKLDSFCAMTDNADDQDRQNHTDGVDVSQRKRFSEYRTLTLENDKLRNECLQYEESEKQLVMKEQKLRSEIAEAKKEVSRIVKRAWIIGCEGREIMRSFLHFCTCDDYSSCFSPDL